MDIDIVMNIAIVAELKHAMNPLRKARFVRPRNFDSRAFS